jgi:hypothetical protein
MRREALHTIDYRRLQPPACPSRGVRAPRRRGSRKEGRQVLTIRCLHMCTLWRATNDAAHVFDKRLVATVTRQPLRSSLCAFDLTARVRNLSKVRCVESLLLNVRRRLMRRIGPRRGTRARQAKLALIVASARALRLVGWLPQFAMRALLLRHEARIAAHADACCQRPIAHPHLGAGLNPSTIERRRDNSNSYHSIPRPLMTQIACR